MATKKRENHRTPTTADLFFGERVRQARMEQKISQQELASVLGVSFQQVQKYEKGKNRVSCGRLQEIASALDRPMAYFFDGQTGGTGSMTKEMSRFLTMKDGVVLAKQFPKLTPPARALIVDLVNHLT